ncbi:hypothetical protein L1887_61619 [Cichorium endivia]|nr:hypothetical protein L1887_61619 [Cichorium endivia]
MNIANGRTYTDAVAHETDSGYDRLFGSAADDGGHECPHEEALQGVEHAHEVDAVSGPAVPWLVGQRPRGQHGDKRRDDGEAHEEEAEPGELVDHKGGEQDPAEGHGERRQLVQDRLERCEAERLINQALEGGDAAVGDAASNVDEEDEVGRGVGESVLDLVPLPCLRLAGAGTVVDDASMRKCALLLAQPPCVLGQPEEDGGDAAGEYGQTAEEEVDDSPARYGAIVVRFLCDKVDDDGDPDGESGVHGKVEQLPGILLRLSVPTRNNERKAWGDDSFHGAKDEAHRHELCKVVAQSECDEDDAPEDGHGRKDVGGVDALHDVVQGGLKEEVAEARICRDDTTPHEGEPMAWEQAHRKCTKPTQSMLGERELAEASSRAGVGRYALAWR